MRFLWRVFKGKGKGSGNGRYTSQPLPMLHPTTPHALPFARISNGKISAGYSHGTVSHVAPNIAVNRKTKKVAAIPAPKQNVFRDQHCFPSRQDLDQSRKDGADPVVKANRLRKIYEPVSVEEPVGAFCPTRERPPTRNMQIPMPTEPQ